MKDFIRSAAAKEARRRLAVDKVEAGWTQTAVADFLGVHPGTVYKWLRAHRAQGEAGLRARPHPGRAPFLTPDQQARVLGWLAEKPTEHGFRTDLWTARRVAELIHRHFGVTYHPGYLREWLSRRGYSPQQPARRARQRQPEAIARWRAEDWPRLQKKRRRRRRTSS